LRIAFLSVSDKESPWNTIQDVQASVSSRTVPALVEILKNRPSRLRVEAARLLGLLGLDARAAQPALVEAIGTDDKLVRRAAAEALAQMGTEAIPILTRLLSNPDGRLREGVARALGQMGVAARSSIKSLTAALKDPESAVRTQAALALWHIDQQTDLPLAVLNLVIKDVDNKDRWEAVEAVGVIAVEARPVIKGLTEVLVNAVKDRDPRVRAHAGRWLFRRTQQARLVTPLLRDTVTDRDLFVRLSGVEALGELGAEGKIVELMSVALEDRDLGVRLCAEEGLARGGAEMVPQLIEALKSKNPRVKAGVARALGLIGPKAKQAIKPLTELSKDTDETVRAAVAAALAGIARGNEAERKKDEK
jgi:HEAT repeat protein